MVVGYFFSVFSIAIYVVILLVSSCAILCASSTNKKPIEGFSFWDKKLISRSGVNTRIRFVLFSRISSDIFEFVTTLYLLRSSCIPKSFFISRVNWLIRALVGTITAKFSGGLLCIILLINAFIIKDLPIDVGPEKLNSLDSLNPEYKSYWVSVKYIPSEFGTSCKAFLASICIILSNGSTASLQSSLVK